MKINKIIEGWQILKEDKSIGLVKRLYFNTPYIRVYLTYEYPKDVFGIAFSFVEKVKFDYSRLKPLKELKISLFNDKSFDSSQLLLLQLLNSNNIDVFSVLCDNLLSVILGLTSENKIIETIVLQLNKWESLFGKGNNIYLTESEQKGLYGELLFLYSLLQNDVLESFELIKSWVGIYKEARDFQYKNWAVEVKTTTQNNSNFVKINGERQLDDSLIPYLFLCHYSLEKIQYGINTLPFLIKQIRDKISSDFSSLNLFNAKLIEIGYFNIHSDYYKKNSYVIRAENIYKVIDDFPRINEKDLKRGISDITYSVDLSNCDRFRINNKLLFDFIRAYHE